MGIRTDLAMEEHELWRQGADTQTRLPGVLAKERDYKGIHITTVRIVDEMGAKLLHKPVGTYRTVQFSKRKGREKRDFSQAVYVLAAELRQMVGSRHKILVVGLGNDAVTPDSVGPCALKNVIVTQHLREMLPGFRPVSAVQPGVLGTTGIESVQIVRAVSRYLEPDLILVIDALASNTASHLCTTVQLTDTGIVPGSGVGNSRAAFDRQTLGAPVIAIGVPTVMDGRAFENQDTAADETSDYETLMLTPKDIDTSVREIGKMIGYAIDLALHRGITMEDVAYFLA